MRRRVWWFGLLAVVLLVVLSGCGRRGPEPTPTPTKTPTGGVSLAAPAAPAETPQPPPAAPAAQTGKTVAVINTAVLNVRAAPSADAQIVGTVEQGAQYDVIGRTQDSAWIQIGRDGREIGWVSAQFVVLQVVNPGAAPVAGGQPAPPAEGGRFLPATMRSPDYGAQAFLWWREEIADRDLNLMREAGFDWVKQAFAWETIEGAGKGRFDWSIADRVVTHVNDFELKLLARLSVDPDLPSFWAGPPPANADHFADFAFAVASRYNCTPQAIGCIQAYQIWNEPNLAREWGNRRPNPAEYVEFLRKAYAAIKRANPNAIVISAGMAPTGDDSEIAMPDDVFYERMYQAMGGNSNGYFDMLGVHGAGFAAPPELDPAEAAANPRYGGYRFFSFRRVEDIRAIMVRYGDADKRVVLLEFGWTFDPVNPSYRWHGADAGITDVVQADYLRRAFVYAKENWRPWIGLMSLLTMPNLDWIEEGDPRYEEQYWWAIMEPSRIDELKLRPAFVVLCIYFNAEKGQRCKYDPN